MAILVYEQYLGEKKTIARTDRGRNDDRTFRARTGGESNISSLLSFVADSVILLFRLGATPPPRSLRASSMRILLACRLLALFMLTYFFFLFFLPFWISIWTSLVFILSFSRGYYAVSSVSVSAATRLAYYISNLF